MSSAERGRILQHYLPRANGKRERYDILDWGSREAQLARFHVLMQVLKETRVSTFSRAEESQTEEPRFSLLDAGCGFAELAEFLSCRRLNVDYTGIDLCAEFIQASSASRPNLDLIIGDVFREPPFPAESFDVVFCSGALNLKAPAHEEFVRISLASMLTLCRERMAVNFLHARTAEKYAHCHYYEPEDVIGLLPRGEEIKIKLIDDYLENDFTLVVHK